jgi:hypothetical protein
MFKWLESRFLWGVLLILGGVLFLLQNLGFFQIGDLFWAFILGLAGVFFLSVYVSNRFQWWALIPGFTLLSIAFLILLNVALPNFADIWGGSIVLGGIGLSFLVIYLVDRRNWWAIIPGGVMLTLTVIAGLDNVLPGMETGGLLFLGMGLTFILVAIIPTERGQMTWAWIPGGILLLMGLLLMAAAGKLIGYLWPLVLILIGGYLILRNLLPRRSE